MDGIDLVVKQEVIERRIFLDDMIKLGKGDSFKVQIQAEISQRMSRLSFLEKKHGSKV